MLSNITSELKPQIHLSNTDMEKLRNLAFAAISTPDVADDLLYELDRAHVVRDEDSRKYVGMGSIVTFKTSSGEERTLQVVLPAEADISSGKISILTPVGVALIGLSEGQSIKWEARDGRGGKLTILAVSN